MLETLLVPTLMIMAASAGYQIGKDHGRYMTEDEMFRRLTLIYAERKQENLSALVLKEEIEVASHKAVQEANPERDYYRVPLNGA